MQMDKFRVGVMAKGSRQVKGIDYEKTFVPTVRFESVRALVALFAGLGWDKCCRHIYVC